MHFIVVAFIRHPQHQHQLAHGVKHETEFVYSPRKDIHLSENCGEEEEFHFDFRDRSLWDVLMAERKRDLVAYVRTHD